MVQLDQRSEIRMKKMRIVCMGTPAFSVGIMEAILNSGESIVGVVTVADKPAGRGQNVHTSAVKQFALANNIPVLQPLKLKEPDFLSELKSWDADVFVVVAFRMLPEEVWRMPKKGTFNLHASLLPDYRGAAPINWAIVNGDKETGVSTFFIDEKIDTGHIIAQTKMVIGENETAGELHDRMIVTGGELVVETLSQIEEGRVHPIQQNELTYSPQRPAPKLFRENTQIDWSKSATEIHHLIRGLSPYPAAWTTWVNGKGERKNVKIFQSRIGEMNSENTSQLSATKTEIVVDCVLGQLLILEFQIEGKKRLFAKDWLVGNSINDWRIESSDS